MQAKRRHMVTQEASEKEANGKERANKMARVKWGEENERQMANNVMREIRDCDRYLVCLDLQRHHK